LHTNRHFRIGFSNHYQRGAWKQCVRQASQTSEFPVCLLEVGVVASQYHQQQEGKTKLLIWQAAGPAKEKLVLKTRCGSATCLTVFHCMPSAVSGKDNLVCTQATLHLFSKSQEKLLTFKRVFQQHKQKQKVWKGKWAILENTKSPVGSGLHDI